nr:UDP-glycosyltransferase [Paris polyphylla]
MESESSQRHFVLVPWLSHGHVIPMMDMARLLAGRDGIHVTVAISPVGAERIRSCFIEPVAAAKLPISFVELPFPCAEAGLPEGVETIEQIQDPSLFPKMHVAAGLLRKPLESKLRELPRKPSVILADLYHPWAREVAADLGVPLLLYYVFPCFTILVYRSLRQHGIYDDGAADASRMFPVPDAPEYMVSRAQAPGTFDRPGWEWIREEAIAAESAAAGVIFHSFDQLEPNFLPKFQVLSPPLCSIWCFKMRKCINDPLYSKNHCSSFKLYVHPFQPFVLFFFIKILKILNHLMSFSYQ